MSESKGAVREFDFSTHKSSDVIGVGFGDEQQKYDDWEKIKGGWLSPPPKSLDMLKVMYGKSEKDAVLLCKSLMDLSRETYFSNPRKKIYAIPHISHRCWLTNPDNPFEAPLDRLEHYVESCRMLNKAHGDWQHYFWCFDPSKIPNTVRFLLQSNVGIKIKKVSEIYLQMKAKHIFNALIKDGRYTNANDILRCNIVTLMGGAYFDIGMKTRSSFPDLVDCFDYMWWAWNPQFVDTSFFASSKNDPLMIHFLDFLDQGYKLDSRISSRWTLQNWIGAIFRNAHILIKSEKGKRHMFIAHESFIDHHRLNSWGNGGKETKFGNHSASESTLRLCSIFPLY